MTTTNTTDQLSLELQTELTNFRRIILAMHTTQYAENECIMKCVKIGTEYDGLSISNVVDRLNEMLHEGPATPEPE